MRPDYEEVTPVEARVLESLGVPVESELGELRSGTRYYGAPRWAVELFDGWEHHNLFGPVAGSMNDPYAGATRGLRFSLRLVAGRPEAERAELSRALLSACRMGGVPAARALAEGFRA